MKHKVKIFKWRDGRLETDTIQFWNREDAYAFNSISDADILRIYDDYNELVFSRDTHKLDSELYV